MTIQKKISAIVKTKISRETYNQINCIEKNWVYITSAAYCRDPDSMNAPKFTMEQSLFEVAFV